MIYDLSQPIEAGMTHFPGDPEPRITELPQEKPWRLSELCTGTHIGTHLDAPSHMSFGETVSDLPLERLVGRGVVIDVTGKLPGSLITLDDVEAERPHLKGSGAWAVFRTGWDAHWNTLDYFEHPSLDPDLARALVAWGVPLVALDMLNPDSTARGESIVHQILLGAGVLIVENLTGLHPLRRGLPYSFAFLPLKLQGLDGSPVRAIAWDGNLLPPH